LAGAFSHECSRETFKTPKKALETEGYQRVLAQLSELSYVMRKGPPHSPRLPFWQAQIAPARVSERCNSKGPGQDK
jgi:hypothetical protein